MVRSLPALVGMVLLCMVAAPADAATLFVANNGLDAYVINEVVHACGARARPCRSITRAILNAAPGDTISVGPGLYGDLSGNGILGEPGEEAGGLVRDPSCQQLLCSLVPCDCTLLVNKAVTLVSSDGAAATVIDARSADSRNVLITAAGAVFGRLGQGFTVTGTKNTVADGIVIDAGNVRVEGNQLIAGRALFGFGIRASGPGALIEGNQVIGWGIGIFTDADASVSKNHVSLNSTGILGQGTTEVVGNVVTACDIGIQLHDQASAIGNAVIGNRSVGIDGRDAGSRIVTRNNVFGSQHCGLDWLSTGMLARNNYWGAATGPGPAPADDLCESGPGAPIVVPFATRPFVIAPPLRP